MIHSNGVETDLEPEDRCYLRRDPSYMGTVKVVEDNRLSCMVRWDDCDGLDFQWSSKLARLEVSEP